MATYKIDRASSIQYSGKFKFDYQVNIVPLNGALVQKVSAGAFARFELKSVKCGLYVGDPITTDGYNSLERFPWSGILVLGNFIDGGKKVLKIPITFKIQSFGKLIANDVTYGEYTETVILYTEPYDPNIRPDKTLSGSIEGEFFVGLGTNEFVDSLL